MRIVCKYSGIPFTCEHFPGNLTDGESSHPIFDIPQKRLFQYAIKWANRELTDTDKYLLYIALFKSTDLLDFRTSAKWTPQINKTIEQNMEALLHIVGKINLVKHPLFVAAHIAITQDTRDFANSPFWIRNWEQNLSDFTTGYKEAELHDKIAAREQTIERLVNTSTKPIETYAKIMADWAEMASEFPTYIVNVNERKIPINEYWKQIIVACCKEERIFLIPRPHVEKMMEHLEDNLYAANSKAAHTLFELVRKGLKRQHNYLGLGDFDLDSPSFRLLEGTESAQEINQQIMVDTAPATKPFRNEYPSDIAFLRAKFKWEAKQAYIANQVAVKKINDDLLQHAEEDDPEMDELDEDQSIDENDLSSNGLNVPDIGEL